MKFVIVTAVFASMLTFSSAQTDAQFVANDLSPTEVASGFAFTEGPAPDGRGGIWFSDIDNANIYRFDIASGIALLENADSGGSNGLMFDDQGRLLAAEHFNQRVTRTDGENVEVLADKWNGLPLNSPNDMVIDSSGGVYFTDPAYVNDVQPEGVYYINPFGQLSQVITGLSRPNGIALSPDETVLYVAEPTANAVPGNPDMKIWQFDLPAPGIPENQRVFVDTFADGLAVDAFGNVFAATFVGFAARNPAGERIFWERTPTATTNVAFANPAGTYPNWFYITSGGSLYRSHLQSTVGLAGDYNDDGIVNAADYVVWRNNEGQNVTLPGDATPGTVTQEDYDVWVANFGTSIASGLLSDVAVPEPTALLLTLLAAGICLVDLGGRPAGVERAGVNTQPNLSRPRTAAPPRAGCPSSCLSISELLDMACKNLNSSEAD